MMGPRADVAQLVERLLAMQKVEGSSPFIRLRRVLHSVLKSELLELKARMGCFGYPQGRRLESGYLHPKASETVAFALYGLLLGVGWKRRQGENQRTKPEFEVCGATGERCAPRPPNYSVIARLLGRKP